MSGKQKYNKLIEMLSQSGVHRSSWSSSVEIQIALEHSDSRDEAIKIIVILLISKIGGVPNFDEHEYGRLYSHTIRKHCGEEEKNPFQFSELPKYSIEEIINEQLIEGGRYIGKDRFIACFNELRSLGQIEDSEGMLDTRAFAQFVNDYFFLNENNHFRIIENLYPSEEFEINSLSIPDY